MRHENYAKLTTEMAPTASAEPSLASMQNAPEDLMEAPLRDDLLRGNDHWAPYPQKDALENHFLRGVFWALLASILFWSAMIWGVGSLFGRLPIN